LDCTCLKNPAAHGPGFLGINCTSSDVDCGAVVVPPPLVVVNCGSQLTLSYRLEGGVFCPMVISVFVTGCFASAEMADCFVVVEYVFDLGVEFGIYFWQAFC